MEYRLKQRDLIQNSPLIAERFPGLSALTVNLMFFDAEGITRHQQMKCTLNLEHAKSMLCFACAGGECVGGDYDLSDVLAEAVAATRKAAVGEMRCQGQRKRGDQGSVPCLALLRYKLTLSYD